MTILGMTMLIQVNKVSGNGISETITPYHTDINDFRGFPIVAGKTTSLFFYCLRLERAAHWEMQGLMLWKMHFLGSVMESQHCV